MAERELSEDLLSALLDDELDAATRAEVEARVAADPAWGEVLIEITETREAIRGLGAVDAPPGLWDAVLQDVGARDVGARDVGAREVGSRDADPDVVDLASRRARRAARPNRRKVAALAGIAAAAAFVVGVAAVPTATPERVRPPVAAFSDAHAARASVGDDAISNLASVGISRFGR